MMKDNSFVFIVGSPRSGTTVLGTILDTHPRISQWYEPYFVWDKYFRNAPHDERTEDDATHKVCQKIYKDFLRYKKKRKCAIVVDKSPRNSLKIPFIQKVFPHTDFIHILRDGRDVTLSIHKEWVRRKEIINGPGDNRGFGYRKATEVIRKWLKRQPFFYDKFRALWFETHAHLIDKSKHLNRRRWKGEVGWGPRFKGWEEFLHSHSILEFNAMQWLKSVEAVRKSWSILPENNKIEIRYEDLVRFPEETLNKILNILGVEPSADFFERIPKLNRDNFHKWAKEFTAEEIRKIKPILASMINDLGYAHQNEW